MQSIIPYIGRGYRHRAFVYDAKREFLPLLTEMWGKATHHMDPFDSRGHPWDMAADITTEADAAQLAGMLIPEEGNSTQRYFPDAARDLLQAVLVAFIETAPRQWTFRMCSWRWKTWICSPGLWKKLSRARVSPPVTSVMINHSPASCLPLPQKSNLLRWSRAFGPIRSRTPISLGEWLETEGVLVAASHPRYSESLRPLTQAIFRRLSDLVLSPSRHRPQRGIPLANVVLFG